MLSTLLKEARIKANLSQGEAAYSLGFSSPQFVSNWERGLSSPPIKHVWALSDLYKINPDKLLKAIEEHKVARIKERMKRDARTITRAIKGN